MYVRTHLEVSSVLAMLVTLCMIMESRVQVTYESSQIKWIYRFKISYNFKYFQTFPSFQTSTSVPLAMEVVNKYVQTNLDPLNVRVILITFSMQMDGLA